jgi:two-component system response regulator AtoC
MRKNVLVVDDEASMRRVLEIMLKKMGFGVRAAGNGIEALAVLAEQSVDLIITDLRMPGMGGLDFLGELNARGMTTPVIVMTAHGTIDTAVTAMKHGARDYLLRPFDIDVLEIAIDRALHSEEIARENDFLRQQLEQGWEGFIGRSEAMQKVYGLIQNVAPTKASVLITGETGTGKELAARAIHRASPRHDKLFVPINCAAIPADILEAELFGYEKGAFTGATKERIGKFELADGGTIFLDELTEMPIALQSKLLRVLQESCIERLGSNHTISLDIRVVVATNRDPLQAIAEGKLREDLYYRVNVFRLDLPPLRERSEDIRLLVDHFYTKHAGKPAAGEILTIETERALREYAWPGNVRELENASERAVILSSGLPLQLEHFSIVTQKPSAGTAESTESGALVPLGSMNAAVEQLEGEMIKRALVEASGSKPRAAALLDISERTLWYKIKKYELDSH